MSIGILPRTAMEVKANLDGEQPGHRFGRSALEGVTPEGPARSLTPRGPGMVEPADGRFPNSRTPRGEVQIDTSIPEFVRTAPGC
jgi:hypothetical protein